MDNWSGDLGARDDVGAWLQESQVDLEAREEDSFRAPSSTVAADGGPLSMPSRGML